MGFQLGVEIDKSRIAWLYDSEEDEAKSVKLTTVVDNQTNAKISFHIKKNGKREILGTETISVAPLSAAGSPLIDIVPNIDGRYFEYRIYLDGRLLKSGSIDIKKYIVNRKPLLIALISIIAVLTAAILLFIFYPGIKAQFKPETPKPAIEQKEEQKQAETAAEEPAEPKSGPEIPNYEVKITYTENQVANSCSVYFAPDSAKLTTRTISGLEEFIKALPAEGDFEKGNFKLQIRGHCAKYGTEEGRAELSKERAMNVYNFLKTRWGIEAESIITGAGASEPITLKRKEQHLNRRVDIKVDGLITIINKTEH